MDKKQFSELMEKLEEIHCGIINVEEGDIPYVGGNTLCKEDDRINQIRIAFFHQLDIKTGWGRNEIKVIFDKAVKGDLVHCLECGNRLEFVKPGKYQCNYCSNNELVW